MADKYAPADSEVFSTLAKLQLPLDFQISVPDRAGIVPLPSANRTSSKQQTAIAIRDGRRAARKIAALKGTSTGSTVSVSGASSNMRLSARRTSLSTVLEQDFTVQGKKSSLLCPFATQLNDSNSAMSPNPQRALESERPLTPSYAKDPSPHHHPADPICAALYETMSPPPSVTGSAAKCPIRFLDQHSPEEVARYFETHKHEIPRSHEVCVKRYQRNEDDIKKLDAKYGNLVSMIQGLGQKHQPMLPTKEEQEALEAEHASNQRVENWAKAVSPDISMSGTEIEEAPLAEEENERESRFDRPLKEIRVGESPSRPWGISVPIFDPPSGCRSESPPPAPVSDEHAPKPTRKCPFGHVSKTEVKPALVNNLSETKPTGECPFPHIQTASEDAKPKAQRSPMQAQPNFIQAPEVLKMGDSAPQMIFTGPVFIGYPMEQAMALMQKWKSTQ